MLIHMVRVLNRIFVASILFLGGLTFVLSVQSCGNGGSNAVRFVPPPSDSGVWLDQFVEWPRIPIRVRVDGPAWEVLSADVSRAIKFWNRSVGCKLLVESRDSDAEVVVSLDPKPENKDWAGAQIHQRTLSNGGRAHWRSKISVFVLYTRDEDLRTNLLSHELGHTLGLRDLTKSRMLLMYDHAGHGRIVHLEALSTLRSLYCRRY